jgi:hypothetical protein
MWPKLKARRKHADRTPMATDVDGLTLDACPGIQDMLDSGDVEAAQRVYATAHSGMSAERLARAELILRHEAFTRAAQRSVTGPWPPTTDLQMTETDGLPEVTAGDLSRETLVAAVRQQGALIVRGLFDANVCADLRPMIDQAMAAVGSGAFDPKWNIPFTDAGGRELSQRFREVNFDPGGRAVPYVPVAAARVLQEFERIGLRDLVAGYLGERPALSLEKWTLRRVPPTTNSSWHQDGAFLGEDKHTLNLWVALSDCGETASGLDMVARRFDRIVQTGTEGAYFDWDVSQQVVDAERGDRPVVSPVFQAGDAVFFDQFLLHRTGIKPGLVEDRYALESWFFTPSSFPDHYEGLLV